MRSASIWVLSIHWRWLAMVSLPRCRRMALLEMCIRDRWGTASEYSNYDSTNRTVVDCSQRAYKHILVDPRMSPVSYTHLLGRWRLELDRFGAGYARRAEEREGGLTLWLSLIHI